MTGLDLFLIAFNLVLLGFVAWVAWNVGRGVASREYQAALASERSRVLRLRRDLADARAEVQHLRLRPQNRRAS